MEDLSDCEGAGCNRRDVVNTYLIGRDMAKWLCIERGCVARYEVDHAGYQQSEYILGLRDWHGR